MKYKTLLVIFFLSLFYYSCKKNNPTIPPIVVIVKHQDTIVHNLIFGTWKSISTILDYPERYFGPNYFYYEDIGNYFGNSYHTSTYTWGKNDTLIFGGIKVKVLKLTTDTLIFTFDKNSGNFYKYINEHLPFLDTIGKISTIAGGSINAFTGDGGPAISADLNIPCGLTTDQSGNIYFMDGHNACMREITAVDNKINTIAGIQSSFDYTCYAEDGLPALSTRLDGYTNELSTDKYSNVYMIQYVDSAFNKVLYKLSATDHKLYILCGLAGKGYAGDGGLASKAKTNFISSLVSDHDGNLYFSDQNGAVIRRISVSDGKITTIAGNGIAGYSGDGSSVKNASINVAAISLDNNGNIIFANTTGSDGTTGYIRKINLVTGIITTIAGNGSGIYSGDGVNALVAGFTTISSIAVNKNGDIYTSEFSLTNNRVRKISASTGQINTIAGNNYPYFSGDGNNLKIRSLTAISIAFDQKGNIILSDKTNNSIRKIMLQ